MPVNPVQLAMDSYFDIIKKPMDLDTIQQKVEGGSYRSFDDFRSDVCLTFDNGMRYNEARNPAVYEMAKEIKEKFETDFNLMHPLADMVQRNEGDDGGDDREKDISAEAASALTKHDIEYYRYCGCGKFDNSGCGVCGLGCNTKQARAIEEGIGAGDAVAGFRLLKSSAPLCTDSTRCAEESGENAASLTEE